MKRIFWLICAAAIASWLIWTRLRQRQDQSASHIPQFAPPRTFAPLPSAAPPSPPPAADETPAAPLAAEAAPPAPDAFPAPAPAEEAAPPTHTPSTSSGQGDALADSAVAVEETAGSAVEEVQSSSETLTAH